MSRLVPFRPDTPHHATAATGFTTAHHIRRSLLGEYLSVAPMGGPGCATAHGTGTDGGFEALVDWVESRA